MPWIAATHLPWYLDNSYKEVDDEKLDTVYTVRYHDALENMIESVSVRPHFVFYYHRLMNDTRGPGVYEVKNSRDCRHNSSHSSRSTLGVLSKNYCATRGNSDYSGQNTYPMFYENIVLNNVLIKGVHNTIFDNFPKRQRSRFNPVSAETTCIAPMKCVLLTLHGGYVQLFYEILF